MPLPPFWKHVTRVTPPSRPAYFSDVVSDHRRCPFMWTLWNVATLVLLAKKRSILGRRHIWKNENTQQPPGHQTCNLVQNCKFDHREDRRHLWGMVGGGPVTAATRNKINNRIITTIIINNGITERTKINKCHTISLNAYAMPQCTTKVGDGLNKMQYLGGWWRTPESV